MDNFHSERQVQDYDIEAILKFSPDDDADDAFNFERLIAKRTLAQSNIGTFLDSETDPNSVNLSVLIRDGKSENLKECLYSAEHGSFFREQLLKLDGIKLTPLHYAAKYNQFECTQVILQASREFLELKNVHKIAGRDGAFPIHTAATLEKTAKNDGKTVLELFLEESLKYNWAFGKSKEENILNVNDKFERCPIHFIVRNGNIELLKRVFAFADQNLSDIQKWQTISNPDGSGKTPAHYAARYNQNGILNLLLNMDTSGQLFTTADADGNIPLHLAAEEDNLNCAKRLTKCDFDLLNKQLLAVDKDGATALHRALESTGKDVPTLLLKIGISKIQENAQETKVLTRKIVECVRKIDGYRALHIAAEKNDLQLVKFLVGGFRAKTAARTNHGETPLFIAAREGNTDVVKFLAKFGGVDICDNSGLTPLLIASESENNIAIVDTLIREGADLSVVDRKDRNILHLATKSKTSQLLDLLNSNPDLKTSLKTMALKQDYRGETPFHLAIRRDNYPVLTKLLVFYNNLAVKSAEEKTVLHTAAEYGKYHFISFINKICHKIADFEDFKGFTAIHLACQNGHEETLAELVKIGCDLEARTHNDWCPLDVAAKNGHVGICQVLIDSGCEIDPVDSKNQTPLHLACQYGHSEVAKLLIENDADIMKTTRDGLNCMDLAIEGNHESTVLMLLSLQNWKQSLASKIYRNGKIMTPLRRMILKMPNAASVTFDKMITNYEKQKFSFDFQFIDDTFSSNLWADGYQNFNDRENFKKQYQGQVFNDTGELDSSFKARPVRYSNDTEVIIDNHPLSLMAKNKRSKLILHPLVTQLLCFKWRQFGRKSYFSNFFFYALYGIMFILFLTTVPPPYAFTDFRDKNRTYNGTCPDYRNEMPENGHSFLHNSVWITNIFAYITAILAAGRLLLEFFQFIRKPAEYFKSITNWIEVFCYTGTIFACLPFGSEAIDCGARHSWQWNVGIVAFMLSFVGFLSMFQKFPRFGIYVVMFKKITKTIGDFFVVFTIFWIAFAFSFHLLFSNQEPFGSVWESLVRTLVLMIGELDYSDWFYPEEIDNQVDFNEENFYKPLSYFIFIIFIFVMSITVMNMLVGLAVDDINGVRKDAKVEMLSLRSKLVLEIENSRLARQFFHTDLKWNRQYLIVKPESEQQERVDRYWNKILRIFSSKINSEYSYSSLEELNSRVNGQTELADFDKKLDKIKKKISQLNSKFNDLVQKLEK